MSMRLSIAQEALNVFEVGVGDTFTSKSLGLWANPLNTVTLFEPNPMLYASLVPKVQAYPNVHLYQIAIHREARMGRLVLGGILSYLTDEVSPINTIFYGKFTEMHEKLTVPVNMLPISVFDAGTIDWLILGMEGAEHNVFATLKSRPHLITLNNHFANDYHYAFPRFEVIQQWCQDNCYQIVQGVPDITLVNMASFRADIVRAEQ